MVRGSSPGHWFVSSPLLVCRRYGFLHGSQGSPLLVITSCMMFKDDFEHCSRIEFWKSELHRFVCFYLMQHCLCFLESGPSRDLALVHHSYSSAQGNLGSHYLQPNSAINVAGDHQDRTFSLSGLLKQGLVAFVGLIPLYSPGISD